MKEMVFSKKNFGTTFAASALDFALQKPMLCPICGAYVDSTRVDSKLFPEIGESNMGFVKYRCTHCEKGYIVAYEYDKQAKTTSFRGFFPSMTEVLESKSLIDLSPGFENYYNQAARAEKAGDLDLAAIGFRTALECLVKDYAIKELHKDREEVVSKKLFGAIGDYLGERELVATADVVRILGNDYTHYERKYPQHDYELLKSYLQIFMKLVETKLMIAHPPLSR